MLHFPKLRIIWSSSPHESVKILSDLKLNHDEPDDIAAITKGSGGPEDGEVDKPQVENAGAVEMLRAIPGVSGHNYRHVMRSVGSVKELAELSEEALRKILGNEKGTCAYNFMHHDVRAARY